MTTLDRAAIVRRRSHATMVGRVQVGGSAPVVVQSMTNTDTADVDGTVAQVKALADAGSELVRVAVGQKTMTLKGETIAEDFERIITDYVRSTYGGETPAAHLRPTRKQIALVRKA